jgi:hypothetical protein
VHNRQYGRAYVPLWAGDCPVVVLGRFPIARLSNCSGPHPIYVLLQKSERNPHTTEPRPRLKAAHAQYRIAMAIVTRAASAPASAWYASHPMTKTDIHVPTTTPTYMRNRASQPSVDRPVNPNRSPIAAIANSTRQADPDIRLRQPLHEATNATTILGPRSVRRRPARARTGVRRKGLERSIARATRAAEPAVEKSRDIR